MVPGSGSRGFIVPLTCAGVLTQIGMTALLVGLSFGKAPPPAPSAAVAAAAIAYSTRPAVAAPPGPSAYPGMARSRPTHLDVPRVGIDTEIIDVGLGPDGTVDVPADISTGPAGWYQGGASPGEVGSSVILGHLDAPDAPAVFFNVGAMRPGDRIFVTRADGARAAFIVREVGSYPRESFPTQAVYGPSSTPVLRLVTCGGRFLRGSGYEQNVVVFADLDTDGSTPAPLPPTFVANAPGPMSAQTTAALASVPPG
jgi:hypothetical protein